MPSVPCDPLSSLLAEVLARELFTCLDVRKVDRRSAIASAASAQASPAISHLASSPWSFPQQRLCEVHYRCTLSHGQVIYEFTTKYTAPQFVPAPWGELPDVAGSATRQLASRRFSG